MNVDEVAFPAAWLRCTCQPPSDVQLDRTLCACGHMHWYCECGRRTDDCPLDAPDV